MYDLYIVKRTQIYLEDEQDRALTKRADATGVTKSTLIRQAIDAYLEGPATDAGRLARFRAVVHEFESRPMSFPDGATYVESIRANDIRRDSEIDRLR